MLKQGFGIAAPRLALWYGESMFSEGIEGLAGLRIGYVQDLPRDLGCYGLYCGR